MSRYKRGDKVVSADGRHEGVVELIRVAGIKVNFKDFKKHDLLEGMNSWWYDEEPTNLIFKNCSSWEPLFNLIDIDIRELYLPLEGVEVIELYLDNEDDCDE